MKEKTIKIVEYEIGDIVDVSKRTNKKEICDTMKTLKDWKKIPL